MVGKELLNIVSHLDAAEASCGKNQPRAAAGGQLFFYLRPMFFDPFPSHLLYFRVA